MPGNEAGKHRTEAQTAVHGQNCNLSYFTGNTKQETKCNVMQLVVPLLYQFSSSCTLAGYKPSVLQDVDLERWMIPART